ncbi:MAG TPA: S53 family peptidase, partial [Acidimicrobiales bacterium]|nr:S53 family peptidase [Acidimicrobiales bacterium]
RGTLNGLRGHMVAGAAVLSCALAASCQANLAGRAEGPAAQHAVRTAPGGTRVGGQNALAWWSTLLSSSNDLGPSQARQSSVIFDLGAAHDSAVLSVWAQRQHLQVQWYAGKSVAVISGPPARLGAALGVKIDDYTSPTGQRFYAATRQAMVPSALRGVVAAVGRISDYKDFSDAYVQPGGLSPTALMRAYDATPLRQQGYTGAGETVVAFEIDGYIQSDLNAFTARYHLRPFTAQGGFSVVGGEAGKPMGESDMDLETVREIAPEAKIVYYNLFRGATSSSTYPELLVTAFSYVAQHYPGSVWTLSIGGCEKASGYANLAAENRAATVGEQTGTSIFAASGDTAGLECVDQNDWGTAPTSDDVGVWNPAVLPAVTGVGGTTLSVTTSGSYGAESAWFYPVLGQGTSGGISTVLAQPSWQVGQGLPTPAGAGRQVPDVSAIGDPLTGNTIYNGGNLTTGGGTSLATPVWAAFTALIDEYLHQKGEAPAGFLNPALYYLADHPQAYPPFHAVPTGGNNIWRNGAGYNQSTGLGSPDVYNLARDLVAYEAGR